jgi:nicotinamide phosphoribosyltransferase
MTVDHLGQLMLTGLPPAGISTDSYKHSHFAQFCPDAEHVYYYVEARKPLRLDLKNLTQDEYDEWDELLERTPTLLNHSVFLGPQIWMREYLPRFYGMTPVDLAWTKKICEAQRIPYHEAGWKYLYNNYLKRGKMPIRIYALPEGTICPISTPQAAMTNTDPLTVWLPGWLETQFLRMIWYASTVASISRVCRQIMKHFLSITDEEKTIQLALRFMLHDFGGRGVSSGESAMLGGLAHLTQFDGTDTQEGMWGAMKYYDADLENLAFSVPAAEHSTIMSWGRDREVEGYRHIIREFTERGFPLVSLVSDTYDLWKTLDVFGGEMHDEIVGNTTTRLVPRPDSGDPVEVDLRVLSELGQHFPTAYTTRGYRKLVQNPQSILQGDGVNPVSIFQVLFNLMKQKWAASNMVFGMGGALLQKLDRDTYGYAEKLSAIKRKGSDRWEGVKKTVATDSGKVSKAGTFEVVRDKDGLRTFTLPVDQETSTDNFLELVYDNGTVRRTQPFNDVRKRARD